MSIIKANRIENLTTTDGGISVDNSGRVLMGTTTEGKSDADDLTVASSGDTGITVRSGTSSTGNLYFSDGTSGNSEFRGYVQYNHTDNALLFGANAGVKGRFISGGGLCFGTDSADANALDDYEEGSFTPTINASLTGGNREGFYTKIGNMVTVWILMQWTANSGAGGGLGIGGLPFTVNSSSVYRAAGTLGYVSGVNLRSDNAPLVCHANNNTTSIIFHTLADNANAIVSGAQNCSASGEIQLALSYKV